MVLHRHRKHPEWFRKRQKKFYNSSEWKKVRDYIRNKYKMRCYKCNKLITGISIVDHIIEISPDNYEDENITLNGDNLQLLCLKCHNTKTFGKPLEFDLDEREDVNLF